MNTIKRYLFKLLGAKNYLSLVSTVFFIFYKLNLLKNNKTFDCHYFVTNSVKKGDVVIDIGANLGYYSVILARLIGSEGKLFAVEPVELFRKILIQNTRKYPQVEIVPYALGAEDGQVVKMMVPNSNSYFSHGRTHIADEHETTGAMSFNATMKRPDTIFSSLSKLDYIKCDIEGYEGIAIPLFEKIIAKFKPVVQIELSEPNKENIWNFFYNLGYKAYYVSGKNLIPNASFDAYSFGDLLFIPNQKIETYEKYIKQNS